MACCAVKTCRNSMKFKLGENISFHVFPKEESRRKQWLINLGISDVNWKWSKNKVVCSEHFKAEDFLGKKLVHNAVPSLRLNIKQESSTCSSEPSTSRVDESRHDTTASLIPMIQKRKRKIGHEQMVWLPLIGRNDLINTEPKKIANKRVCSKHFFPTSISRSRLKRDAIPEVFEDGIGCNAPSVLDCIKFHNYATPLPGPEMEEKDPLSICPEMEEYPLSNSIKRECSEFLDNHERKNNDLSERENPCEETFQPFSTPQATKIESLQKLIKDLKREEIISSDIEEVILKRMDEIKNDFSELENKYTNLKMTLKELKSENDALKILNSHNRITKIEPEY